MTTKNLNKGKVKGRSMMNQEGFQRAQQQVEDVIGIMRENVNKVVERDSKLGDLDSRAASLEANSVTFATSSTRLRKKYWWQNMKMKLIIATVIAIIIAIIIIVIVYKTEGSGSSNSNSTIAVPAYRNR